MPYTTLFRAGGYSGASSADCARFRCRRVACSKPPRPCGRPASMLAAGLDSAVVQIFIGLVGPEQLDEIRRQRIVEHVRSEEHTSELQSLMRNSYAGFCLKKKQQEDRMT